MPPERLIFQPIYVKKCCLLRLELSRGESVMAKLRFLLTIALFFLIVISSRESQAVIYKYMNEKGMPIFTDELQKVPEQFRASAVVVSGGNDYDAYAEQEKARLAAKARAQQEFQAKQEPQATTAPVRTEETISARLIRSGVAVGLFIALLFVVSHVDAIREQAHLLSRIRTVLVLLLLAFLGFTHVRDVMGLFGKVEETVVNPVASIQEQSAERGKKAAEAFKSMDKILDQRAQEEEARLREIDRKYDDAEKGR
jgi:septum formation inhibitor MinC